MATFKTYQNIRQHWVRAISHKNARLLLWASLGAGLLGFFLKLTSELREGELEKVDQALLAFFVSLRVPTLNGAAVDITALGSATLVTIFCFLGVMVLCFSNDRLGALFLALGAAGAGLFSKGTKLWIARPRPEESLRLVEVSNHSYPSGHSLTAAAFYFLLALMVSRHFPSIFAKAFLLSFAALLVGLIGLSRAYLGVHYPSDILSGILLGTAWACALTGISSYFKEEDLVARES